MIKGDSEFREHWLLLLHHAHGSRGEVLRLKHGRIQRCNMIETFLHGMISAIVETHFGGGHCDGALACDLSRELDRLF